MINKKGMHWSVIVGIIIAVLVLLTYLAFQGNLLGPGKSIIDALLGPGQ